VPPKTCTRCKVADKAPGKQKCHECLMLEQSPYAQEMDAERRLACVPVEMRLAQVPKIQWPVGRRWCSGCQSFRRVVDCVGSRCQVCAGRAAWEAMLPRTYVIHGRPFTADDYRLLYREQRGRCRLCKRQSISRRMAIDHDHLTGQVRGLLCPDIERGCNAAVLGNIRSVQMAYDVWQYLLHNYAESIITE
jgi:hypothetical protein